MHLPENFDFSTPFGVILAIVPAGKWYQEVCKLNWDVGTAQAHCEQDPILFDMFGDDQSSIPHMTLLQMWMRGENDLHHLAADMELTPSWIGGLDIYLDRIETWNGDEWLFWFPNVIQLSMNEKWHYLRIELFEELNVQRLRFQDHELPEDSTPEMREWHRETGYAYCDLPHITLASLKPGAVLPAKFPRLRGSHIRFERLVLGLRGPRDTITQIIYEVPLGG